MQHPDYPDIDFKPAIARYDWDQTYDVLEFVHLPQGFGMIANIPCSELMAVDRFTPYSYRWAENYSDYLYDFCKAFNFSPHNSIYQRTLSDESGQAIKDEDDNSITVPAFEYTGAKYEVGAVYNVTFPKGEYQLTMLIDCGYQEGLIGGIRTLNQVFYAINITEDNVTNGDNVYDLNKIIKGFTINNVDSARYGDFPFEFCANSIVISKRTALGTWQEYTVSGLPPYLLYKDIATHFNGVKGLLIPYFSSVYALNPPNKLGCDTFPLQSYLKEIKTNCSYERDASVSIIYGFSEDCVPEYICEAFPSPFFLDFCYLQKANNSFFESVNPIDLGIVPLPRLTYPFFNVNYTAQRIDLEDLQYNSQNRGTNIAFSTSWHQLLGRDGEYLIPYYLFDYPLYEDVLKKSLEFVYPLITTSGESTGAWLKTYTQPAFEIIDSYENIYTGSALNLLKYFFFDGISTNNTRSTASKNTEFLNKTYSASHKQLPFYCKNSKEEFFVYDYISIQGRVRNDEPIGFDLNEGWTAITNQIAWLYKIKLEYGFYDIPNISNVIISNHELVSNFLNEDDVEIYKIKNDISGTIELSTEYEIFTGAEVSTFYNHNTVTDAVYLAYLQGLKLQYEEDSATW